MEPRDSIRSRGYTLLIQLLSNCAVQSAKADFVYRRKLYGLKEKKNIT